jgi:cephalosporin-C deacetylase-like acetyl esterase
MVTFNASLVDLLTSNEGVVFCGVMIRSLIIIVGLLALAVPFRAEDLRVLTEAKDPSPQKMMHEFLMTQVQAALDRRDTQYQQLKTADELAQHQQRMRQYFLEALGGFPERTPLNPRIVAAEDHGDYRLEKVIFESQPRHFVTALLYLPKTKPPYPGVLVPCGHSGNGKASEAYQRISILLARNGLASFCYDPIEQGERFQLLDEAGKPLVGGTTAHCLVGVGSTLLGRNTATFRIWDGMRAIDYMQSREEIDPQRIGCTGNSGGGTLTSYLMALDPRIACAAPSCYLCGFRRLCETIGPQDAEQNIHGQIAFGLDHSDYILIRAPKPTLMCTATHDFFDIDGAWDCFRQAKRFYTRLGFPERVDLIETDAKHGFSLELRIGAVRWMRRWLLNIDDAITEPELALASDEQLQCTPKGQVMLMEGARNTYDLNIELEEKLVQGRKEFWHQASPDEARNKVRQITGIRELADLPKPQYEITASTEYGNGQRLHKLILQPKEGIPLPALAFVPIKHSGEAYLYLHAAGKHLDAGPDGPIERLVKQDHLVLAVDLRGLGETALDGSSKRGIAHHIGSQWKEFYLAYLLGTSYLAMRTEDILVSARFLAGYEATEKPNRVHVISIGRVGPPALHAAALEPKLFASVTLRNCLNSWASVVRSPMATNQFENVVHGALKIYDLPDLLGMLPKEEVTVVEPLHPAE